MATHDLELVDGLLPSSNNVFPNASVAYDTNDRYPHEALVFQDTATKVGASGRFRVPQNYASAPKFCPVYRVGVASGDVVWDVEYTAIAVNGTESGDPSTDQEALSVTSTVPGTSLRPKEEVIAATAGNFAAGDLVLVTISRDGAAADTAAADVLLESFVFRYDS